AAQDLFARFEIGEAQRQLAPALALFEKVKDPELEATARLLAARLELGPVAIEPVAPEALARAERHLLRALDLREERFGMESLEVAEVLEAFPADEPRDPVAALVRTLRLIDIYEAATKSGPDHTAQLARAYEAEARLRDATGDTERAELALERALATAQSA